MSQMNYQCRAGLHPITAALRNQLAFFRSTGTNNGEELSEAMLLGIGGGLGAGYILWGAPSHESLQMMLNFRNNWQYPLRFLEPICERLGLGADLLETGSVNKASHQLRQALEQGRPATVWVKQGMIPHWQVDHYQCWTHGYVITVFGVDDSGERYSIDDKSDHSFAIGDEELSLARAGIPSFKNRLLTLAPPATIELEPAIRKGLADCVAHLSASSDSFGLPAFRKWARMLTHRKSDKGWPKAFATPTGLFQALSTIYEATSLNGGNGGSLRELYGEFLDEARQILGLEELREAAQLYRQLGRDWEQLGEAALPDDEPVFHQAKALLRQRYSALTTGGESARETLRTVGLELSQIGAHLNREFPWNTERIESLFQDLQTRVHNVFEKEVAAREALRGALEMGSRS